MHVYAYIYLCYNSLKVTKHTVSNSVSWGQDVYMALRTYLPKLLFIMRLLCSYIRKYREKIDNAVGPTHTAKVDALVTACEVLEAVVETLVPNGP